MVSEKVLHIYSDVRKTYQRETWKAFKSIDPAFQVEHVHVVENSDYADTLKRNWGKGHKLIIIEQDIVATPNHIGELLKCRARLCAFPYLVKANEPGSYSIFNFARYSKPNNWKTFDGARYIDRIEIDERPKYCGLSGFGLTKIGPKAQELIDFPNLYDLKRWDIIDSWLSLRLYEKIRRNRIFHLHYPPVKHNHYSQVAKDENAGQNRLLIF